MLHLDVLCIFDCGVPEDKEFAYLSCSSENQAHINAEQVFSTASTVFFSNILQTLTKYINYFHMHPGKKKSIIIDT